MARIRLAIAGSVKDLSHADQRTLLNRAQELGIGIVFLTDHTVASLVGDIPVIFFTGENGQISTRDGVPHILAELEKLIEAQPDYKDSLDVRLMEYPEEEQVEVDCGGDKIPHLERGGFLGRRKRGGGINYRRVK